RHGQPLPVRAGDGAALRGQRDGPVPFLAGQLAVTAGIQALQLDQAAAEEGEDEDDREQGNAEAPAGITAGGTPARPGRPGRGPVRGTGPGRVTSGRTAWSVPSRPHGLPRRATARIRTERPLTPRPGRVSPRLRPAVVPAVRLRPARGVLWCHGLYP